MSDSQNNPLRYPIQVYQSLGIEPKKSRACSDTFADFLLCQKGLFFNGVARPLPNESLTLDYSPTKFNSKQSSTGMQFYQAKETSYCDPLRKVHRMCEMRNKILGKGELVASLGVDHLDHLTHLGLPGIERTVFT